MKASAKLDLVHDLFLPTLLFAALGGMTWAVRGSSGYGGSSGCIFAGIAWGTAWWFISRDSGGEPTRRYASAWIVLAVTLGVGISGARGWMQWPSFFEGKLQTDWSKGESEPISRVYGFIWLFIAGMPWAGIGACLLAWCGSLRTTRIWHWAIRIGCGIGGAFLARFLFDEFPQYFLPLYGSLEARYQDLENNPNLKRLINDSGSAIMHLGAYLGLLAYEIGRRDWKNVLLISTVGIANGIGWSLLQNWKWAPDVWPGTTFNWWRCWESTGGISIGIAYGLAYFLVNRRMSDNELAVVRTRRLIARPSLEWLVVYLGLATLGCFLVLGPGAVRIVRLASEGKLFDPWKGEYLPGIYGLADFAVLVLFGIAYCAIRRDSYLRETPAPTEAYGDLTLQRFGLYLGLLFGLGFSIRNGLKGWFNIYRGNEDYYSLELWKIIGPTILALLVGLCAWVLIRPVPRSFQGDVFPHADKLMWLMLIVFNVLAQLITGPLSQWNEFAFNIYYVLLFLITAAIVVHYGAADQRGSL